MNYFSNTKNVFFGIILGIKHIFHSTWKLHFLGSIIALENYLCIRYLPIRTEIYIFLISGIFVKHKVITVVGSGEKRSALVPHFPISIPIHKKVSLL